MGIFGGVVIVIFKVLVWLSNLLGFDCYKKLFIK